ncbi:RNA binding protein, putative [Ricinus communis]|uniref:RNA binding protein, putative n=1 Tax=Ricinus communis TaxID=3988 RepID=B9T437_RICCO|nr:RNA binding protein, putative [Ricinus communis]
MSNLVLKRVNVQDLCPLCSKPGESIYYALIDCSFVKEVWVISVLISRGNRNGSICDWLQEMFTKFEKSTWGCIAVLVWNLWIHRNEVVWYSKRKQPTQIVDGAVTYLHKWLIAQQTNPPSPDNSGLFHHNLAKWKKPKTGWPKCNIDAAIFNQQGMIGADCVLRNTEGAFIGARINSFVQSDLNPKLAEDPSFREQI